MARCRYSSSSAIAVSWFLIASPALAQSPAPRSSGKAAVAAARPDAPVDDPSDASDPGRARRGWGIASFVAGGVAITLGTVAGGVALAEKGSLIYNCDGPACNADGIAAADRARAFGTASTVLIVGGAVALATGFVLVLTAPSAPRFDRAPRPARRWTPTFAAVGNDGAVGLMEGAW